MVFTVNLYWHILCICKARQSNLTVLQYLGIPLGQLTYQGFGRTLVDLKTQGRLAIKIFESVFVHLVIVINCIRAT